VRRSCLGFPFQIHVIWHGIEKNFALHPPKITPDGAGVKSIGLKNVIKRYYEPQSVSTRQFVFLYHGGLLWRKGIDRLIQAYVSTFTESDQVVLIIHYAYASGLNAEVRQPPHSPLLSPVCGGGRRPGIFRAQSSE
jgi:hypothetical protein